MTEWNYRSNRLKANDAGYSLELSQRDHLTKNVETSLTINPLQFVSDAKIHSTFYLPNLRAWFTTASSFFIHDE